MLKLEKPQRVKELEKMIDEHSVVALLNMHKLPARQLQQIRDSLREKAMIKMSKKSLLQMAISNSKKKNLADLLVRIQGEPALILSNENPFRLFRMLKNARSPAAAKIGDTAPNDITVQKGSTNLPPGPAISTLQKVGLKTTVQGGKIAISQDKVVIKSGEKINDDVVNVLNLLKLEPMEIGLDLIVAYEEGILYEKTVLDIDTNKYLAEIQKCITEAINLSVNAGYPTSFTIEMMVQKAFSEAKSLCVEANIIEREFIDDLLAKAAREAQALEKHVGG